MALGGGYFIFQNKELPGSYINFVSQKKSQVEFVDRGVAALPIELDWGATGGVFRVDAEDFQKKSESLLGYEYSHDKMKPLRDLFLNAKTVYFYRLNSTGERAKSTVGTARYAGVRGNDLSVTVQADLDNTGTYNVITYMTTDGVSKIVDQQTGLTTPADLENNDYVLFTKTGSFTEGVGTKFTGGTNGTAVTSGDYQKFIGYIEGYYFNVTGYAGTDATIQGLFKIFAKRCREETGQKFQVVLYNDDKANYEGVISVLNKVTDEGAEVGSAVYWTIGAEAGCEINRTCTNKIYDGEYTIDVNYKQYELIQAIKNGQLMFHNVTDPAGGNIEGDVRILKDINTFTEFSKDKNRDFAQNQVIRVLDNWAYDTARLFNKQYLGKEGNDEVGHTELWKDLVKIGETYQKIRAIKNFNEKDISMPYEGDTKESVVVESLINPVMAMEKLYNTVTVA